RMAGLKEILKLAALVAAILAASFAFVSLQQKKGYGLTEGALAPPLRLPALQGAEVDLESYRGHVVLVNFWATWCPPCVEEMPSLERLHRALAGEGLVVLGVSIDDDGAALEAFVRRAGVTFPIVRDPGGRGGPPGQEHRLRQGKQDARQHLDVLVGHHAEDQHEGHGIAEIRGERPRRRRVVGAVEEQRRGALDDDALEPSRPLRPGQRG